jgi:hypothetical protein
VLLLWLQRGLLASWPISQSLEQAACIFHKATVQFNHQVLILAATCPDQGNANLLSDACFISSIKTVCFLRGGEEGIFWAFYKLFDNFFFQILCNLSLKLDWSIFFLLYINFRIILMMHSWKWKEHKWRLGSVKESRSNESFWMQIMYH